MRNKNVNSIVNYSITTSFQSHVNVTSV